MVYQFIFCDLEIFIGAHEEQWTVDSDTRHFRFKRNESAIHWQTANTTPKIHFLLSHTMISRISSSRSSRAASFCSLLFIFYTYFVPFFATILDFTFFFFFLSILFKCVFGVLKPCVLRHTRSAATTQIIKGKKKKKSETFCTEWVSFARWNDISADSNFVRNKIDTLSLFVSTCCSVRLNLIYI